jgi:hypothetical protein
VANINELLTAISFGKQADIATAQDAAHMWRVTNLNAREWGQNPISEDDAAEVGKGHEFASAPFKSHYLPGDYELRKYLSSEMAAWAFSFALGNVVKSGVGPFTYTITPILGSTNPTGLELPYATFVQQIRPGGSSVLDQLFKGCAVRTLRLSVNNSPGRQSAMLAIGLVTTGQYTEPSAITIPAAISLNEMNAGTITALTINGIDYFTSAKNFQSFEWAWDNNFRPGFFVGSGSQDGFQTQGRFEIGDRAHGFSYIARFVNGSSELTKLRALTTGTAVITFTKDANNSLQITEQKLGFRVAELGETNGIVTVGVTASPMYDSTNGLVTVVAKCGVDGICQ